MSGFVENVNAVANAVNLSTGDIVEDTKTARGEAVTAAESAALSESNAAYSERLAHNWANKGHNNPVVGTVEGGTAEYSAYHWAVETALKVGDPLINDSLISASYTWSSEKLNTALVGKASSTHNHNGVYEPAFVKSTAFNKNFAGSGSATTVARSDHNHTGVYEPIIPVKKTGFNLDTGTTAGTLATGDHKHDTLYMPKVTPLTAYNKNFVVDTNNPTADEIPRGNHTHKATGVSYDNTGNKVITSTTAQGAINQLDTRLGSISVAEKCYLTAGMTDASYSVPFTGIGVGTVINAGITIQESRNAIYSSGGIKVNYPVAPGKLVQGLFDGSVTITAAANTVYALRFAINGVIDYTSKVVARLGSATSPAGTFSISLGCFIEGLSNGDVLSLALVNETSTTSVTITAMSTSFAGEPEGALVISGSTVLHNDVTGRDALLQHPTTSIYETGTGTGLDVLLDRKADKVTTAVADNMLMMDSAGNLVDSGISNLDVQGKMDKVATPVEDTIIVADSFGNAKQGTAKVSDLALKGGSATQQFLVEDATLPDHAVNKGQMDALATTYAELGDFNTHVATANPHGTTYTDVGAAAAVHTHAISDVTNLQTTLDNKYNKVVAPVTGNLVKFGAGGVLVDGGSGIDTSTLVAKDSSTGAANIPTGTEAQRPATPTAGMLRFNNDVDKFEGYNGTAWGSIGGTGVTLDTAQTITGAKTFDADITLSPTRNIVAKNDAGTASTTLDFGNPSSDRTIALDDLVKATELKEIGVGQTWQNVTASRSAGVTYTNTTGKPIQVIIVARSGGSTVFTVTVGGETFALRYANTQDEYSPIIFIVPDGITYSATGGRSIDKWLELR